LYSEFLNKECDKVVAEDNLSDKPQTKLMEFTVGARVLHEAQVQHHKWQRVELRVEWSKNQLTITTAIYKLL
jgi:hypothetical protein